MLLSNIRREDLLLKGYGVCCKVVQSRCLEMLLGMEGRAEGKGGNENRMMGDGKLITKKKREIVRSEEKRTKSE